MSYSWVLFDIDGTLFDYDTAETAALAATFTRFHLDLQPNHAQAYRRINGRMWVEFEQGTTTQERLRVERFRDLFEAIEIDADPTPFSDEYLKQLARRTDLIAGAESTAAALASRVSLMVITNGLADVQRPRFAASSIRHHFQGIVISEEVGAAKPDPRIFDEAFARMDHPPKQEVLIVGDSLFVHGGILPEHVDHGLERMNAQMRAWLRGETPRPEWLRGADSPVWSRHFSDGIDVGEAQMLTDVLDRLDVRRMVVGHTIQDGGVASFCAGKIWCIDVGMAAHYGDNPVQVLEIEGEVVRVLREP